MREFELEIQCQAQYSIFIKKLTTLRAGKAKSRLSSLPCFWSVYPAQVRARNQGAVLAACLVTEQVAGLKAMAGQRVRVAVGGPQGVSVAPVPLK